MSDVRDLLIGGARSAHAAATVGTAFIRRTGDGSCTNGGLWRTGAQRSGLGCSPIRKQGLRNSGFRDVADQ